MFTRDRHRCRVCGAVPVAPEKLDAHHIMDRHDMPAGGYVAENGISLCPVCHLAAEQWHATGATTPSYEPEALYGLIGSSLDLAYQASDKLAEDQR